MHDPKRIPWGSKDGGGTTGTSNQMAMVYFKSDTTLWVVDGGSGFNLGNYVASTWYHIEFTNIDWTSHTFDASLDGVPVVTGRDFRGPIPSIDRLDLYHYQSTTGWWDEIQFN